MKLYRNAQKQKVAPHFVWGPFCASCEFSAIAPRGSSKLLMA